MRIIVIFCVVVDFLLLVIRTVFAHVIPLHSRFTFSTLLFFFFCQSDFREIPIIKRNTKGKKTRRQSEMVECRRDRCISYLSRVDTTKIRIHLYGSKQMTLQRSSSRKNNKFKRVQYELILWIQDYDINTVTNNHRMLSANEAKKKKQQSQQIRQCLR